MSLTLVELNDNLTSLTLAPALGASIVNWTVRDTSQPLLRHSDQHALNTGLPGKLACYPLVPWSNRIAKGGFDTPDGWLALTPNSPLDPCQFMAAPGNRHGRWSARRRVRWCCNWTAARRLPIAPSSGSSCATAS